MHICNFRSPIAGRSAWRVVLPIVAATLAPAVAWADDDNDRSWGGGQPNDSLPVYLDRNVHPTAQDTCTPGFIWQGAGNPATTFQRKRNFDAGVELAIKGIIRQGPDIRSTYVDGDGLVHIEVPTGPQVGNPSRAAWNFTYSYDVALDPSNPTLDFYDGQLWIDLDPSEKTRYLKLRLARIGPTNTVACTEPDLSGFGWKSRNTVVIGDDEGSPDAKVTQNSQNLAFYATLIDTNPNQPGTQPYTFGPGEFDVVMILGREGGQHDNDDDDDDDEGHRRWTILHVVFDVVPGGNRPEQTP
jgi:hypothetical protein